MGEMMHWAGDRARTRIRNISNGTRRDDDDARLGLLKLASEQMHKVVLGYDVVSLLFQGARSRQLTNVIHHQRFAPLGVVQRRLLCVLNDSRVQQQIIDARLAQLGQRLLRKGLDVAHVGEIERQHRQGVRLFIKLDSFEGRVGRSDISRAKDNVVRLRLLQEELDGLKAL